jgi:hypothetical protein
MKAKVIPPSDPRHPAWEEYNNAAQDMARRGLKGQAGDLLPMNMSTYCVMLINADPKAFAEEVSLHAYAQAMQAAEIPS